MKAKCYNVRNEEYKNYGDLEIEMCDEWYFDYGTFESWDTGKGYTDESVIIRLNKLGDFEPSNCDLVTKEEGRKKQSNRLRIPFDGREVLLSDIANKYGLAYRKAEIFI